METKACLDVKNLPKLYFTHSNGFPLLSKLKLRARILIQKAVLESCHDWHNSSIQLPVVIELCKAETGRPAADFYQLLAHRGSFTLPVKYKDYYQTLGVTRQATDKEIKTAYRNLARSHHPDLHPGNKQAEEKFKEITEAYEVLKDPDKRRRYDMLGANWKAGADFNPPPGFGSFNFDFSNFGKGGAAGGASPFSDFFDVLFGQTFGQAAGAGAAGAEARRAAGKPANQEAEIELTIEELARGTARNIQISKPGQPPKTLQVKIPAGVRPGSKVRVPGEAATPSVGGQTGDLFLKVRVKPHPFLTIEGDNLISELQISAPLAVIGGEATVNTLDGSVHINVPPLSQAGRMLRLRERGLPKLKQSVRGDHLVKIKVVMPSAVTPEEKELWEKLLQLEKKKS